MSRSESDSEPVIVALLVGEDEEMQGQAFPIVRGENRLGRALDNHVRLPSPYVSRHHATLVWDEGVIVIVPAAGKRVRLNGEETPGDELQMGDLLELGSTRLRLRPAG